jgi:DNA-binding transcriptional ArsR family regulator
MIERLSEGPVSASELAKPLGVSLAAVVQHLQLLEGCSLVRSEKVGRTRLCRMEPAGLRAVEKWITDRRASWERRFDRLGNLLAEDPPLPDADP